jgi:hypothetical protein
VDGGGYPAEVQEAEGPHETDGPQRSLPLPLPRGGGDAQAERAHPPAALQRAAQLDVLHQRDLGVAAERLEVGAPQEDGLIAGADAGGARAGVHGPGDHAEERARVVEAHVEAAAHHPRLGERPLHGPRRARGQARVGVQEQQRVAAGRPRAVIHLERPAARAREEPRARRACHHGGGLVAAAAVHHDDFRVGAIAGEVGQEAREIRRLVESRDDDGEPHRPGPMASAS